MEQLPQSIVLDIDLRRLHEAFIKNIQGNRETLRSTIIPNDRNFIVEKGYTDRNGNEIRTSILRIRLWPVTDESREKYGKKQDWDAKLEISKEAREQLQQTNPKLYAQLQKDSPDYDREIIKQVLPYIGVGYNQYPRELPQEQVGTVSMEQAEGDDDLPF